MNINIQKKSYYEYLAIKFNCKLHQMAKKNNQIPKAILFVARRLEAMSTKLTTKFAVKLFVTPIKHKIPKRELNFLNQCSTKSVIVPTINKEIIVYEAEPQKPINKKALLVHGWSGRGTQLFKIAENLLEQGYHICSFDAPAHGKAKGKKTLMPEFIASIEHLSKSYNNFDIMIGHSLGGMSIMNAVGNGVLTKKIITIGAGDKIEDIVSDFVNKLEMSPKMIQKIQDYFHKKYHAPMSIYDVYTKAQNIDTPTLIIHDNHDEDVSVDCAHHIHKHHKNSQLMITNHLGHRKILGNQEVIATISKFIAS